MLPSHAKLLASQASQASQFKASNKIATLRMEMSQMGHASRALGSDQVVPPLNNLQRAVNVVSNEMQALFDSSYGKGGAGATSDIREMGEMESLRLQMAMDRLSKMMSTLSNLLKKMSETSAGITQNLK